MDHSGQNLFDTKRVNRARIYNLIREKGNVSRKELAYTLQLSLPTVNQNLSELMEDGYIRESGLVGKTVGRRATVYSICEDVRVAIGIDITKNHIIIVCVNLNGEAIYRKKVRRLFERSSQYSKYLSELVDETVECLKLKEEQVTGVGIAVPGLITLEGDKIFYGKSLNFTGMTCKELAGFIPYEAELYNDADAAGYAEAHIGNVIPDSFYVSLNNSVGGAILINGQVYRGERAKSGEIGHMTLEPEGEPCFCGQKGCLDVYCNATVLSEHTDGDLGAFFESLNRGNQECMDIWENYLRYLALGINNIRMLFDCKIILGGYVGAYLEPYLEELKKRVIEKNPFEKESDYLKICKVKGEASAMGAALPFVQKVIDLI